MITKILMKVKLFARELFGLVTKPSSVGLPRYGDRLADDFKKVFVDVYEEGKDGR